MLDDKKSKDLGYRAFEFAPCGDPLERVFEGQKLTFLKASDFKKRHGKRLF